jgi:hypothetical protein
MSVSVLVSFMRRKIIGSVLELLQQSLFHKTFYGGLLFLGELYLVGGEAGICR